MPGPGAGDDVVELRVFGSPAEFALDGGGAGDEDGGVARAAWMKLDWDGMAGDSSDRVDDLLDGEATACSDVVHDVAAGFESSERQQVRVGQVGDVDVVAHACAVGGGVVVAVNADGLASAQGDIEDEGDQVRFGLVIFAVASDCAGHVEVAQGSET